MGWPALSPASALEKTMKYSVSPLTCGRCVGRITEALQRITDYGLPDTHQTRSQTHIA